MQACEARQQPGTHDGFQSIANGDTASQKNRQAHPGIGEQGPKGDAQGHAVAKGKNDDQRYATGRPDQCDGATNHRKLQSGNGGDEIQQGDASHASEKTGINVTELHAGVGLRFSRARNPLRRPAVPQTVA
ncbi:MAG: hypothetical protein ACD_23C00620G0001 [uncultured bacterium]|nr:MAG: hypothetical protein ACD_23C00620G0001 [uncultured bacterium]